MKKYLIYKIAFFFFITVFTSACTKDSNETEINLAYQMLGNKTWFLEYSQYTNGGNTTTNTFVGQSTYFINFLSNFTTKDSDGITGTYTVVKNGNQLQILVSAKTANGNNSNYQYNVISLGAKQMVLSSTSNTTSAKYYYSTQK